MLVASGSGTWAIVGGRPEDRVAEALSLAGRSLCRAGGCGACRVCREPGASPDFHAVARSDSGEATIDAVRDLTEALRRAGHGSDLRVGYLPDADRLGAEAASALLKALEEPPAGAWYLLTAPSPASLPDAIRSRCAFRRLGPAVPRPPAAADEAQLAAVRAFREAAARHDPIPLADALLGGGKAVRAENEARLRGQLTTLAALLRDQALPGQAPLAPAASDARVEAPLDRAQRLLDLVRDMDQPLHLTTVAEHAARICVA